MHLLRIEKYSLLNLLQLSNTQQTLYMMDFIRRKLEYHLTNQMDY